jgi:hypothetical protein
MKKLFTMLTVVAISTTLSFAQQGTVILGANTQLSNAPWSQVVMTPSVGYFVSDQMAIGLGFSLGTSSEDDELDNGTDSWTETESSSEMSISPWMRFYLNEIFFINAGITLGSGSGTDKTTDKDLSGWTDSEGILVSERKDKAASFDLDIGAGASILWGKHIAFEPMFGLQMGSSSVTYFDQDKEKGPSTINVGFRIGVCVMLGN